MSQFLIPLSNVLHTLATVIFIGHYLLLSLLYLPVLTKMEQGGTAALSEISKRSRVWLYIALGLFAVTGIYLTLVDPYYLGLGNFQNPWSVLMLVKHILILGMIGVGFWFNVIVRVGSLLRSTSNSALGVSRLRLYSNLMSACGILVLILTAIAQLK
jgi:uncharacterized membrane protein